MRQNSRFGLGALLTGASLVFLVKMPIATAGESASVAPIVTEVSNKALTQLVQQGREYYQAAQYAQAIAVWQQAERAAQAQGNALERALVLSYVSLAYQQLGQWQQAQSAIAESLALIQQQVGDPPAQTHNSPASPQAVLILAQALNTRASLEYRQGQTEAALNHWQQATALYTQLGDEPRRIGTLINQAQAQQTLGLLFQARRSLTELEQALQQQPDALKALGLRSLGNVWLLLGNSTEARRVLQQSLVIAKQQPATSDLSAILLSLGNVARAQQDATAALAFYQQSAATPAPSSAPLQAQLNQLSLLVDLKQTAPTAALISTIQAQLAQRSASRATIYAQINLAQSLLKLEQQPGAIQNQANPVAAAPVRPRSAVQTVAQTLASAVQHARTLGDRRAEAYALIYLGQTYERTRQWTETQQLTEQALLLAQATNAPDIAYQGQWQLGRVLKAQAQPEAAIRAYDAALTTLQSLRSNLVATSPDLQFSFRESVEPVYREYVDLLLQTSATSDKNAANLRRAREVIESLRLAELDDFFRTACLEGQTVAIDEVKQTDAAVLYPILLNDRLEVILSLPGKPLRRYTTIVSGAEMEAVLKQFRQTLEQPLTTPEGKRLGAQLYNWLIRPIASELEQQSLTTLTFVLDGSLRNIPIAALYDGKQYLIERYSIALSPGLRLLAPQALRQRGVQTLAAGLTESRHGFEALPGVGSELQKIESSVTSQILLNQAFTSLALQRQINAQPFPVVHLATHGQFSSNANETFILAWDKPINVNELSTLLRGREDGTNTAIELLVLSACETAAGDKRAALGLAGVAVQAGARSTLASLWSLDDESGALFMGEFYRQLTTTNVSKAEAVRRAQLALLRHPIFRHPRYWSPYVLLGNWL